MSLQDHLLDIWSNDRPTMLFVTHDIDEALMLADRVIVLLGRPGRIRRDERIDLPRPRRRGDPRLARWRERLFDDLCGAADRPRRSWPPPNEKRAAGRRLRLWSADCFPPPSARFAIARVAPSRDRGPSNRPRSEPCDPGTAGRGSGIRCLSSTCIDANSSGVGRAGAIAASGCREPPAPPPRRSIDAQVHAYERNHPGRPWAARLSDPEEMTGDQMVAAMDAVGVDGAVLVSPITMYRYDPSYVLEVRPSIRAGSAWSNRSTRAIPPSPKHRRLEGEKGTVGVRILLARRCLDRSRRSGHQPGAGGGGTAFAGGEPVVHGPAGTGRNGGRNPEHADRRSIIWAWCSRKSRRRQPSLGPICRRCWRSRLHPNVVIKITGACTLSQEPFPYSDIWDPLCRIFDAFGLDRCLWGTDWTRAIKLLTYAEGVDAFRVADRLSDSDRTKLMGGTASRVYKWSPSQG